MNSTLNKIKDSFFPQLNTKTSWGLSEVKDLYRDVMVDEILWSEDIETRHIANHVKKRFFIELEKQNSWGKNVIKDLYRDTLINALIDWVPGSHD
jgi:hypothetical protein